MIKRRCFPESNYIAIYSNGKTIRVPIDKDKPITELTYPEFYDICFTHKCHGNCPYCYIDSKSSGNHVEDVEGKLDAFFGSMEPNQRPFQIAAGGSGNPNEHPNFISILEKFVELGITPNYTTNGMGMSPEILDATKRLCGGVAVSCHPHLDSIWRKATQDLLDWEVKTSLHHIISSKESVDTFLRIREEFPTVSYHVLLPLIAQGRATEATVENIYLFEKLKELPEDVLQTVAFGAKFYPELLKRTRDFNVSLYEPESMSKYLDMENMTIYGSSFDTLP